MAKTSSATVTSEKHVWQAWVNVKWKPGTPADAWETWASNSNVKGAWSTQGEWDASLWVDVKTPDELEKFVWSKIRNNKWVEATETHWAKRWI